MHKKHSSNFSSKKSKKNGSFPTTKNKSKGNKSKNNLLQDGWDGISVAFDKVANLCASLATSAAGQKIKVYDVSSNKIAFELTSPLKSNCIRSIAWCEATGPKKKQDDPNNLALCCENGSILIYSLKEEQVILKLLEAHSEPITDFVVHGQTGFSSSIDGKIGQWNLETGELIRAWNADSGAIYKLGINPKLNQLISGANTVKAWSTETGRLMQELSGHVNRVTGLVVSDELQVSLTAAHQDRFIAITKLKEAETGAELEKGALKVDDEIRDLTISPESSVIATTICGRLACWPQINTSTLNDKVELPLGKIEFLDPKGNVIPVAKVGYNPTTGKFIVARGNSWNIKFEPLTLPKTFNTGTISYKCLDPSTTTEQERAAVKAKAVVKSSMAHDGSGGSAAMTLGEKLRLMEQATEAQNWEQEEQKKNIIPKKGISAGERVDSLAKVLSQALHTKDIQLLTSTLQSATNAYIIPTVELMPPIHIPALAFHFMNVITHNSSELDPHVAITWLKNILLTHTSQLTSVPHIASEIGNMLNSIEQRAELLLPFSKMAHRLELTVKNLTVREQLEDKYSKPSACSFLEGKPLTKKKRAEGFVRKEKKQKTKRSST